MTAPGWLTSSPAEVPAGEQWLGPRERAVLAGLRIEKRRADWRLGRWSAKRAVAAWLDVAPERVEIVAAADGAPEAWIDGRRAPVSVSLSHRAGRALATVVTLPSLVGCDLELVEPRSAAFAREWLAPPERRRLAACPAAERAALVNGFWTAKEAAAKLRRAGLRLDVRRAVADVAPPVAGPPAWRPLSVAWDDGAATTSGWVRHEPGWVMAIAGDPPPPAPRSLQA
jgi:4'-phosphopantetheinyl transferase